MKRSGGAASRPSGARLAWIALVALLSLLGQALAQGAPADDPKSRARARFMEGKEHFTAGRLAPALKAFQEANQILPTPLMLSNIAQVYESMEDFPQAVVTLEAFVASGKADDEAKGRLARLKAEVATWPQISLTTEPPGAEVRVTGADYPPRCAATPCTVALPPGMRTLHFTLADHQPLARTVRFAKGQTLSFPTVVLAPVLGTVTVRTTPPGARVALDGGAPGVSPFTQSLALGEHVARVTHEGYVPAEQRFTVTQAHTAAAPLTLDLALEKGVVLSRLEVVVDREDAEVFVDDQPRGRTPLAAPLELAPGIHRLRVVASGAEPYEEVVNLAEGQTTRTLVTLEGKSGGFSLNRRTVSFGLMGLGAASLVGAGVTGALALGASGDLDDCRADGACRRTGREVSLADDVRGNALTTDILLGAGVALAATGVVLFLLDGKSPAETEGSVEAAHGVGVSPTPGGAAAAAWVHF